jgi:hypothetical protein
VDEDTGCWHWLLAFDGSSPKIHYWHPVKKTRVTGRGRNAATVLSRGKDIPKGHIAFPTNVCKSPDCCNPRHCRTGTKKQWGQWLTKTGQVKGLPVKCAAARKAWDKRGRKITPEGAAHIRASDKTNRQLAADLGVSQFAVWSVRHRQSHIPTMANASVFTWRP